MLLGMNASEWKEMQGDQVSSIRLRRLFQSKDRSKHFLKMCQSNQGSLAVTVQVWDSVRPMHLRGHNLDHDYYRTVAK
jgi:hypothetical protein